MSPSVPTRPDTPCDDGLRRRQWRSLAWLAVCALVSALMILWLLYGLGPIDPH